MQPATAAAVVVVVGHFLDFYSTNSTKDQKYSKQGKKGHKITSRDNTKQPTIFFFIRKKDT